MRLVTLLMLFVVLSGCATTREADERARAKVHTELAAAYFERKQYAVALQEVGVAKQADDSYAPVYNLSGLIRMALREDDQAEADFRRGMGLDPDNSEMHNNYGWFLCQRGREKDAIQQFLTALKNPLYATPETAYANAGICSRKIGDLQAAESYLQRALILHPDMPEALYGLADVSYAKADYPSAKAYFLRFQQQDQDLTAEQLWLAVRIERKMRDRNAEASYAMQLSKRFPDSREAQLLQMGE